MKRITSFVVAATTALFAATTAQAQLTIDWDDNGQFTFYPEELICEGGVSYDEDSGAFVFDGTPGSISLPIPEGKTMDWTMVARLDVTGSMTDENGEEQPLTYFAWNSMDPLATFTIYDRDMVNSDGENAVNTWMGSRYAVNLAAVGDKEYHNGKTYAALCPNVTAVVWRTRDITDEDGNPTGECVTGSMYIDEVVLTKSIEKDPKAISDEMFYEWDDWGANAQPVNLAGCDYNLEKPLGTGAVLYGTSVVLGKQFANLSEYAGIYAKGTPGVSLRLLFNRSDMEGGSAPISECNPVFDDNGEFYFYFEDLTAVELGKFGEAYPYVHLNTVKLPWGFPEGVEAAKITKLNYIEKGEGGVHNVAADLKEGNDRFYNLYGQPVDASYKGIIIKNGKKFINR